MSVIKWSHLHNLLSIFFFRWKTSKTAEWNIWAEWSSIYDDGEIAKLFRLENRDNVVYALWRSFLKGWFHSLYCCKENAGWLTAPLAISGGSRDQMRPSLPTIQFAYRRWPSRQRNERNILGNILNYSHISRMSGCAIIGLLAIK